MSPEDKIQTIGAMTVIVGHCLNAIGPETYPWNIVVFGLGAVSLLAWGLLVRNRQQIAIYAVSLSVNTLGVIRALGLL